MVFRGIGIRDSDIDNEPTHATLTSDLESDSYFDLHSISSTVIQIFLPVDAYVLYLVRQMVTIHVTSRQYIY